MGVAFMAFILLGVLCASSDLWLWCLTLMRGNSQSSLFSFLFFSSWDSHYVYVTLGAVPQSLVLLLCFLVSFQSSRIPLGAGACDSFFSATCLLMRPSQAFFFSVSVSLSVCSSPCWLLLRAACFIC